MKAPRESGDILSNRPAVGLVYALPILALVVTGFLNIPNGWRMVVWVAALTTMGTGCLVNAFRCGRVHCYLTGPFFLAMAMLALFYGLGVAPLGARGWSTLSLTVLIGAIVLTCVPEMLFGRYRRNEK